MKRKANTAIIDADFDIPLDLEGGDASSPLDVLFDQYYTPTEIIDPAPDASFLDAITDETAQLSSEFEKADDYHRHLSETKKATNSGVDADYYFSIVFVSEQQKSEFLAATGWSEHGGTRFLNGVELARAMGIELSKGYLSTEAKSDKKLMEFVKGA